MGFRFNPTVTDGWFLQAVVFLVRSLLGIVSSIFTLNPNPFFALNPNPFFFGLGQDAEEGDALSMVFTPGSGYAPTP